MRDGASDEAALDGRGEAVDLFQTTARGVSVAQRRAKNAIKCLRDPRHAPEPSAKPDASCFLPVEIVDRPMHDDDRAAGGRVPDAATIEINTAGGHRLRVIGTYDPEALARLIRGLAG